MAVNGTSQFFAMIGGKAYLLTDQDQGKKVHFSLHEKITGTVAATCEYDSSTDAMNCNILGTAPNEPITLPNCQITSDGYTCDLVPNLLPATSFEQTTQLSSMGSGWTWVLLILAVLLIFLFLLFRRRG